MGSGRSSSRMVMMRYDSLTYELWLVFTSLMSMIREKNSAFVMSEVTMSGVVTMQYRLLNMSGLTVTRKTVEQAFR